MMMSRIVISWFEHRLCPGKGSESRAKDNRMNFKVMMSNFLGSSTLKRLHLQQLEENNLTFLKIIFHSVLSKFKKMSGLVFTPILIWCNYEMCLPKTINFSPKTSSNKFQVISTLFSFRLQRDVLKVRF